MNQAQCQVTQTLTGRLYLRNASLKFRDQKVVTFSPKNEITKKKTFLPALKRPKKPLWKNSTFA
jgi:hypothetical protein